VTERGTGRVLRFTRDAEAVPLTFPGGGDAVPDLAAAGEGGLLGIETAPDGDVLLYHSTATDNRIVRYEYDAAAGSLSDPRVLLSGIPTADTHNGGRIAIGPDGHLYAGTGDAQDTAAAQDPDSLAGKILRVTLDGEPAPGNPFPGSPVWSLGHRNVQGIGWAADGTMVASEFGQNTWDELNVITPGANYGWPEVEGPGDGGGEFTAPAAAWSPSEASPSGLAVTGDAVYVAGLRGQRLWRVPLTGDVASPLGTPEAFLEGELGRLRDVAVTPEGTLWVLTNNTSRGTPRPGDDRVAEVTLVEPPE
jgi:glucose/arabinose dehydrogenase